MEKRSLRDKLNAGFFDSLNTIREMSLEHKGKDFGDEVSGMYDEFGKILPNRYYLGEAFGYFLSKEDSTGETIPVLNAILDYAKNRLPRVNLYNYFFDVMNKEKKIKEKMAEEVSQ